LSATRQVLEEEAAARDRVELKSSTQEFRESRVTGDTGQQVWSNQSQRPFQSGNDSGTPLDNPETITLNQNPKTPENLFPEELQEQTQSGGSSMPSRYDHCTATIDYNDLITMSTIPSTLYPHSSPFAEQEPDLELVPNINSTDEFIGPDFDSDAVDFMKSSALSCLEGSRDLPLEYDSLPESCQMGLDTLIDEEFFTDFLDLENQVSIKWKDKHSGNRAVRQP
jgi:hypothetical protein